MKLNRNYIWLLSGALFLNGCIKDKGNYDLLTGNKVDVKYANPSVVLYVGDTLRLDPVRTFSNPADTADFDHKWYANGKFYSDKPRLELAATETAGYTFAYYMTDRKSGITYSPAVYLTVSISSRYIQNWGILYQDANGNTELAHVNPDANGTTYTNYTGLYQKANGVPAGTQPVKMRYYNMRGTPCLFVIQKGAPGALDLSAADMKKKLVVSQSFTQGNAPADFEAVDMAFYNTADMVVTKSGDVYGRFFNGAAVFTIPWMSTPMSVARGCKITDIWDSWYKTTLIAFMYDRLNKRVLQSNLAGYTPNGGVTIDSLPLPVTPYPADYTSLHNLGDWEYIWGGTFHDSYGFANGALLIRNPADGQVYYEDFAYKNGMGQPNILTPGKRILFPGSSLINSKTRYAPIKNRDYLFYSGGADNKQLYYFDALSGTQKTYITLPSPITSVTAHDNLPQMAVGLEDGTFLLYDVSNEVMLSGQPKELYRLSGLGKVVDIVFKSYSY
ncbi:PKD-like family lipoprotein [Chitinophaga arvensicola]|uniref:PKD-like family protein n=1 Tax=Chitinophaga arvensicola TaxID=29529 RepID=A0A1I0NLB0_9BACT|nr:PKD-like family lipoprotein [Chitinophaga arvensicola]SEW02018.1 PKD-like family protein [Chitinophaga arvensicola]